jgi:hypothetical protein
MISSDRGHPTTPLQLAVPAEVVTPHVPTKNSFAHLGQDDTSTHDSGRATNANKEVGDVIGRTINAIRDAEEVAK